MLTATCRSETRDLASRIRRSPQGERDRLAHMPTVGPVSLAPRLLPIPCRRGRSWLCRLCSRSLSKPLRRPFTGSALDACAHRRAPCQRPSLAKWWLHFRTVTQSAVSVLCRCCGRSSEKLDVWTVCDARLTTTSASAKRSLRRCARSMNQSAPDFRRYDQTIQAQTRGKSGSPHHGDRMRPGQASARKARPTNPRPGLTGDT